MWHRLADHRLEVKLAPFTISERTTAVTLFERELGEKVRPELRRQIIENSQGYPWLLKKLCIHLYEQVQVGISQADLAETFDVASLFDNDRKSLTPGENNCLKRIAQTAPADWFEILETYGHEVLRALQDKRLIVRSGDRINLYWDIFREYILTNSVPSIPFTYLPSSPSLRSLLEVATQLDQKEAQSYAEIGSRMGLVEKTVGNIVRDLVMFSVATTVQSAAKLDSQMESASVRAVMERIRHVLKRHALTLRLAKIDTKTVITTADIIEILKQNHPSAKHRPESWRSYSERMALWLTAAGLIKSVANGWVREDRGDVLLSGFQDFTIGGPRKTRGIFIPKAPPAAVYEVYDWLRLAQPISLQAAKQAGYRNSMEVLIRLNLVRPDSDGHYSTVNPSMTGTPLIEAIWKAARNQPVIQEGLQFLDANPNAKGKALGRYINETHSEGWAIASEKRVGDGLRIWVRWIADGIRENGIPPLPKGRARRKS